VASELTGRLTAGGTDGNERLTTVTGVVLLVLLAVLGVTILRIRPLLNIHMFLGVLLIGPVVLKLASTGYRFVRYYTAEPRYRRKGPPAMALRLLAPLVVLSTLVVFASGVVLLLAGTSSRGTWLPIHKISFIVWVAATTLHVLGHLADLPRVLRIYPKTPQLAPQGPLRRNLGVFGSFLGPRPPRSSRLANMENPRAGREGRAMALGGALVAGAVLGILSIPQFAPWLHTHFLHH
jgi:hypothetical protein